MNTVCFEEILFLYVKSNSTFITGIDIHIRSNNQKNILNSILNVIKDCKAVSDEQ